MTLRPAPSNTGIIFQRVDLPEPVSIPALSRYVTDTAMCTTIGKDGASISTIEHLMSALVGLQVDNVYVDIDQPEMAIMDGSSAPFVFLMESAGFVAQSALKQYIRVKKAVTVEQGDKSASLLPYDGFKVTFHIDFQHPAFKDQPSSTSVEVTPEMFITDISRARTFGFAKDAEKLRAMNLALGASLDNTVVLDDTKVLNPDGLRYRDEFAKHKILDAIGDLALLGKPLLAHFVGVKSGHAVNSLLVNALLADPDAYEIVTEDMSVQAELLTV